MVYSQFNPHTPTRNYTSDFNILAVRTYQWNVLSFRPTLPPMKPSLVKGTRDFLPAEVRRRDYLFGVIRKPFRRFGYISDFDN